MMMPAWVNFMGSSRAAAPVLPDSGWMAAWQTVGWSVVLVYLALRVARRWQIGRSAEGAIAIATVVLVALPSSLGLGYWLGTAFQSPSVTAVLLCGWCIGSHFFSIGQSKLACERDAGPLAWVVPGLAILLGWGLLLDALGWLPLPLYRWGFHAAAPLVVAAVAGVLWVFGGQPIAGARRAGSAVPAAMAVMLAVAVFTGTRLPAGNLWDAVLDPWLWMVLQWMGVRTLLRR